jgi:hypothetical protein
MTDYEEAWRLLRHHLADSISALGEENHGTPVRRGILHKMEELEKEPAYYTLQASDVGKRTISAFGKTWHTSSFIGRVLGPGKAADGSAHPGDVGKRVFKIHSEDGGEAWDYLQVENDSQFHLRLAQERKDRAETEHENEFWDAHAEAVAGKIAPVISQSTLDEVARVGREYPDGVHTCSELQQLEPGRRPCTCGRCITEAHYHQSDGPPGHRTRSVCYCATPSTKDRP